ncbi:MAG: DUF222 domain-containing protein [Microcella sp.]|uniref:HNH endonuclease signature motif containing protein n=1 Tax=Microcella sp. TaxID=1913979 RepID=UPI0033159006
MTAPAPFEHLTALVAVLERAPLEASDLRALGDEDLLAVTQLGAKAHRLLDARTALVAGELARRSRPELAHDGLAQRTGHRTVEELVRVTTGDSRRDAVAAVNAGRLLVAPDTASDRAAGADDLPMATPHLAAAVRAVRAGALSIGALDAISTSFDGIDPSVRVDLVQAAVERLVASAEHLDVDRVQRMARHAREELDAAALVDRERIQRDARSFRLWTLPDGMTRATWMLDPEPAAQVRELVERATSPKRRGVHFVETVNASDDADAEIAVRIAEDERTPEQYASDALLHLLAAGADADSSMILGTGAPQVSVLVTAADLARGEGSGSFEPSTGGPNGTAVALPTVQRLLCGGVQTPILIGSTGQPLDVGRSQRLFTARQRIALAARDGGCRWPGCERPPSWCEAHHIDEWERDRGRTDINDGILLCRHHHLLLHDHGWQITRVGRSPDYELLPPATVDPLQRPRPMPSRSRQWQRALAG